MGNLFSRRSGESRLKLDKDGKRESKTSRYASIREDEEEEALEVRYDGNVELEGLRDEKKGKQVIDFDDVVGKEDVSEVSSFEQVDIVGDRREGRPSISGQNWKEGKSEERDLWPSNSSLVMDLSDEDLKVDSARQMLDTLSLSRESDVSSMPVYNMLLDTAQRRDAKLHDLRFQITLEEKRFQTHQLLRHKRKVEAVKKVTDLTRPYGREMSCGLVFIYFLTLDYFDLQDVAEEAFKPLSEEEKAEVAHAFSNSNWNTILASHRKSNIDITGELLQCLRPGEWLNDEVINVYLELLKERESRDPQKFLKCHFFNTFFYNKLISGRGGYNFQAVRRWTSQKKLGYCLLDCDKIFVPVHKQIHWCLAVINKEDKKFQYLDSLGGSDTLVTNVLARYYIDEVKDKSGKDIDVSSWGQEFVENLPEQENGFDCGMFMIKYADFYSRGITLCFNQEHMPYFRLRTAKEILRLKAE